MLDQGVAGGKDTREKIGDAGGQPAVVPPASGARQVGRVADAFPELEPVLAESDYAGAFADTLARFRRRSLLVLLTLTYASQLTDRIFQSFLPPGSVGALSYAWVVVQLMPGLLYLGSAFMTVFAERRQQGETGAAVLDPLVSLAVLVGLAPA